MFVVLICSTDNSINANVNPRVGSSLCVVQGHLIYNISEKTQILGGYFFFSWCINKSLIFFGIIMDSFPFFFGCPQSDLLFWRMCLCEFWWETGFAMHCKKTKLWSNVFILSHKIWSNLLLQYIKYITNTIG